MNGEDKYLLSRFQSGGSICPGFYLNRLQELSEDGYCVLTRYADDISKPNPEASHHVVLTGKGMEAIGG